MEYAIEQLEWCKHLNELSIQGGDCLSQNEIDDCKSKIKQLEQAIAKLKGE